MFPPRLAPIFLVMVLASAVVRPQGQPGSPLLSANEEEDEEAASADPEDEGGRIRQRRHAGNRRLAFVSLEDSSTDSSGVDPGHQSRNTNGDPLVSAVDGPGPDGGHLDVELEDPLVSEKNESSASWRDKFDDHWSTEKKLAWLQHRLLQEETKCLQLQHRDLANARHARNWTSSSHKDAFSSVDEVEEVRLACPRVWDSIMCWGPAEPNTTLEQPCPDYVPGLKPGFIATRTCLVDGTWFEVETAEARLSNATTGVNDTEDEGVEGGGQGRGRDAGRGSGWTNYSLCLTRKTLNPPLTDSQHPLIEEWLPVIKQMSLVGYSVSLGTLVVSFVILASLRKLRCPRNLLHLHLFASFMLRAIVVLVKSSLLFEATAFAHNFNLEDGARIFNDASQPESQTWSCKLMICVWQYFILANYSWILMEGLYLHNLIFMALFTDSSAITMYIVLGWGLPWVCVGSWATLRSLFDNEHCWTVNNSQWIFIVCIKAPVGVSNVANFFFFLNVTRVLLLKLRSSVSAESDKYRKLGRSTLVLVPLFGVHYFLLLWLSTSTNTHVELLWLFLDQVFASFQGFFVAVLYCLMNGEVRQELRKLYSKWILRYKGDAFVLTSHSTLVSHTKTYASRGRMSLHSIHSTAADRRDRQTPSPQMAPPADQAAHNSPRPSRAASNNSPNPTRASSTSPNPTLRASSSSSSPRPPSAPSLTLNLSPPAPTPAGRTSGTKDTNLCVQTIELCETSCTADTKRTPSTSTTTTTCLCTIQPCSSSITDNKDNLDPLKSGRQASTETNCAGTKPSPGETPLPSALQNGYVLTGTPKGKSLSFSDTIEKPFQVKGEIEGEPTVDSREGLNVVVDVNPKSLTSIKGPVEVKAHILQGGGAGGGGGGGGSGGGGGGGKEHETML